MGVETTKVDVEFAGYLKKKKKEREKERSKMLKSTGIIGIALIPQSQ